MERLVVFFVLLVAGTSLSAQTMDTVLIVQKAKKFKTSEHILLMFEMFDTLDASGKKVTMSRSYYFDKKNRKLSSVREYDNPKKPERGTQVVYSFGQSKLTAVAVVPPRSTCKNCASEYFFAGDTLLTKNENIRTHPDPTVFIQQANYFLSKLPSVLPWGYFEDEVIVNGKMKKVRVRD